MAKRIQNTVKILELLGTGFEIGYTKTRKRRKLLYQEADITRLSIDRKQLHQTLNRLKVQNLINITGQNDEGHVQLTNKGRRRVIENHLKTLSIKKLRKWDKKWRMVMYDIPEKRKSARDALRRKLLELGFIEFQKSAFIFPYPCDDQINFVINYFEIENNVYLIDAVISPDKNLRQYFKI